MEAGSRDTEVRADAACRSLLPLLVSISYVPFRAAGYAKSDHPSPPGCLLLARNGHAAVVALCPLLGEQRKTYARIELFRLPLADIDWAIWLLPLSPTIKILTVAPELRSGRAWVRSKRLVIWKNDGLLRL